MPIALPPPVVGLTSGDPNFAVVGTGTSVTTGIEDVYEYNGVLFNDLTKIDKIRIMEIGGFDDADLRDSREVNPADHGETAYDAFYGGRTITIQGRIEAYSLEKLRDMQMGFKQTFNVLQEMPLIVRTGNTSRDYFINCRKSAALAMKESQTDARFFREFMVTLRASNPRIMGVTRNITTVLPVSGSFPGVAITNNGNFAALPEIQMVGSIVDLQISNDTTGQIIKVNGTIPNGSVYDMNMDGKTFTDQTGAVKFNQLDVTSDWMELAPGVNNLSFTTTSIGASGQLIFYHHHTYM